MAWQGSRLSQGCGKVSANLGSICLNNTAGRAGSQESKREGGLRESSENSSSENNPKGHSQWIFLSHHHPWVTDT